MLNIFHRFQNHLCVCCVHWSFYKVHFVYDFTVVAFYVAFVHSELKHDSNATQRNATTTLITTVDRNAIVYEQQ